MATKTKKPKTKPAPQPVAKAEPPKARPDTMSIPETCRCGSAEYSPLANRKPITRVIIGTLNDFDFWRVNWVHQQCDGCGKVFVQRIFEEG